MISAQATNPPSAIEAIDDQKNGHLYDDEHREVATSGLGDIHFGHMSPEERAAALKLAQEIDPGPSIWSLRYLQFIFSLLVVIVCSCDNGFDSTIMSSVNSMTQFQSYFGLVSASKGTGILFVSP
jgi:hypothetical protein